MPSTAEKEKDSFRNSFRDQRFLGKALIFLGVFLLLVIYWPLAKEQARFWFSDKGKNSIVVGKNEALPAEIGQEKKIISPVDENFGIVIPKISANSAVVADVDPNDSQEYQKALSKGVAHAQGSARPGESGNVFIFAHSGLDFPEAMRYNAVFYLLNEMEKGDEVFLFYQGKKLSYQVRDKKVVKPEDIQYLKGEAGKKTVTLMTCWPAGSTLKRLIIIADEK